MVHRARPRLAGREISTGADPDGPPSYGTRVKAFPEVQGDPRRRLRDAVGRQGRRSCRRGRRSPEADRILIIRKKTQPIGAAFLLVDGVSLTKPSRSRRSSARESLAY